MSKDITQFKKKTPMKIVIKPISDSSAKPNIVTSDKTTTPSISDSPPEKQSLKKLLTRAKSAKKIDREEKFTKQSLDNDEKCEDNNYATYLRRETIPNPIELRKLSERDEREELLLSTGIWQYEPMYRENVNGKPMIWQIGFDINTNELLMTHGQVDGKIRTDRTLVEVNQSGRNIHQQSILEANSRYNDKYDQGYRPPGETKSERMRPMLANTYKPGTTKLDFPVDAQPKLDGVRCNSYNELNDKLTYLSRQGKSYTHLANEFDFQLKKLFRYLPTGWAIDGEYYTHGLDFEELIRSVKNVEELYKTDRINYYIYDNLTTEQIPWEERWQIIEQAVEKYNQNRELEIAQEDKEDAKIVEELNQHLEAAKTTKERKVIEKKLSQLKEQRLKERTPRFHLVPTHAVYSEEELFEVYNKYRDLGYEGIMIRKRANGATSGRKFEQSLYRQGPGRCGNILKLKDIQDEEGEIIDVVAAKGTEEGAAIFVVKDPRDNTFNLRMKCSVEQRREWYNNKKNLIGKKVTYEFQNLTKYGVPRHPRGKAIRDYE